MLLSSAYEDFIEAMIADGYKWSTVGWYKALLGKFIEENTGMLLQDVTTKQLRQYIVSLREQTWSYTWHGTQRVKHDKPLAEDTINAHIRCLHRFFSWSAANYTVANPMTPIKYPSKPEAKPKAIALENVLSLFDAALGSLSPARDRAILAFLIDTGCRAGGLVNLSVGDIELTERRAIVTEKGDKTRTLYFTEITAALLAAWMAERAAVVPIFYNLETLKPLTTYGLRLILKRLAKRAGVEGRVNPHSFRHSFAREYLRAGGDLSTLSRLMGHRAVETTIRHYAIFTDAEVRDAHDKYSPAAYLGNESDPSEGDESP